MHLSLRSPFLFFSHLIKSNRVSQSQMCCTIITTQIHNKNNNIDFQNNYNHRTKNHKTNHIHLTHITIKFTSISSYLWQKKTQTLDPNRAPAWEVPPPQLRGPSRPRPKAQPMAGAAPSPTGRLPML
jgi:hypothetical protein